MDFPYIVEPRRDTGLYNAKLGIWLFLASEVMLFGALFSAYVLLRVGAEPGMWPHGWLNVPLGTLNTLVLITSSITTVLAWVALKEKNFGKFKLFHAITLICALTFVGIKSFEYRDKFMHYEIQLADGQIADGHFESATYMDQTSTNHTEHIEHRFRGISYTSVTPSATNDYSLSSVTIHGHKVQAHMELMKHANHAEMKEVEIPGAAIKSMQNYGPWHNTYTAIYFTLTGLHALHVIGGALVIGYLWLLGGAMWKTDPERFTNRIEVSGLFWHFVDLVWIFLFPVLYLL